MSGADAVGMSTVPEAIVAAAMRIECGGGFVYHKPGGGHRQGKIVARGSFGTAERVKNPGATLLKNFAELYGKFNHGITTD